MEGDSHSPYSFFKSLVTQLVKNYGTWYGLKYSICYFYNVYGPYQDTCATGWETVISIFEKQFKAGKPLTIVGDGTQRRDFTYVGDIVNGLIKASAVLQNDEYQLGSGTDYSILEVAKMFSDDITFIDARQGDRRNGKANTSETFTKLGWKPEMNLVKWIQQVKR
jgi:UDP-glucose 4-epimerase